MVFFVDISPALYYQNLVKGWVFEINWGYFEMVDDIVDIKT